MRFRFNRGIKFCSISNSWFYISGLAILLNISIEAQSAELPSVDNLLFQTSGSNRCGHIGDWYTTNGSGNTPNCNTDSLSTDKKHRFSLDITQEMLDASGGSIDITIIDAESTLGSGDVDEVTGASDPTRFELVAPNGTILDSQIVPSGSPDNTSIVFTASVAGTYQVTSETGARFINGDDTIELNDDDNSFAIELPDVGTSSELQGLVGQFQGTMQHNAPGRLTFDTYFLVGPGTNSLELRNFDLDGGTNLSYFNSQGNNPGVNATVSGNGIWNTVSGNLNTGGDIIEINSFSPNFTDAGLWRININNLTNNNQFALEANSDLGRLVIYDRPPARAGNFIITPDTTRTTTIGTAVDHAFSITNLFATTDIINLSLVGTEPNHTVELIDASTGQALTDIDNDGNLDTGILDPNQTINLILRVTPNTGSTYIDTTKIDAVSFMDNRIDPNNNVTRSITKTTLSPVSPKVGQIVINEVLFKQRISGAAGNDEFIELYNPTNSTIDFTGWQLIDGNLQANDTDGTGSINGSTGAFTFPTGTILEPGEYAVVWIGSKTADKQADNAAHQFYLERTPKLNNNGDDIWLYDPQTRIVDYIAYGSNNAINTPPDISLNLWNNTYQTSLRTVQPGQSISLSPNGTDSNNSGCWEATTSQKASSPSDRCPTYLLTRNTDSVSDRLTTVGLNNNGARLALVKRITNVIPNRNGVDFNRFVEDGTPNNADNNPKWHSDRNTYLRGQIEGVEAQPGDEIEYTIYFLSDGGLPAQNVLLCDVIPNNTTFIKDTYGTETGIALGLDSNSLPATHNLELSNLLNDDGGEFYAPGTTPPAFCKQHDPNNPNELIPVNNNSTGAVVVDLDSLPPATEPGVPTNSYGFMRFRVRVD